MEKTITVSTAVNATIDKVWNAWNLPEHITQWYFASDDWHAPKAENNLQVGSKFSITMAAKDGSFGFDLIGEYINIKKNEFIEYNLEDGRNVQVAFEVANHKVFITESFEPENVNTEEMQRDGWQAILDNFKKYVEQI
ncbi:MAG: SRPBCC domain-containing protein [Bacteroidetes bacterium]|nr:SRPBCC domain-containing protein [Bacteroidota bacterium]